jgi:hypothetical protein
MRRQCGKKHARCWRGPPETLRSVRPLRSERLDSASNLPLYRGKTASSPLNPAQFISGIVTISIRTGTGTDRAREFYRNATLLDDVTGLPQVVLSIIENVMRETQGKRR